MHAYLPNMKMYKEKEELARSAENFANFILQMQLKMGRKTTKSTKKLINLKICMDISSFFLLGAFPRHMKKSLELLKKRQIFKYVVQWESTYH